MDLSTAELLGAYRRMSSIRAFEEKLAELVMAGKLSGFLHLYAGQEAVAVGVCAHLTAIDVVTTTHRGHGHCIAKGVDVRAMMAELFGRSTGVCKGKGGSMHIADLDRGMLGANGIVGASIPLAVGAALSARVKKTGGVAVAFFGDGATNQGQFHEALNLAAVWRLPVVFVVENNLYGEATPYEFVTPVADLADRAAAYAMPAMIADGMDFLAVHEKGGEAIERARGDGGPTLLECKTYRYFGHYVGDPLTYRRKEESEEVRRTRDPIDRLKAHLMAGGIADEGTLRSIEAETVEEVAAAVGWAQASPEPLPEDLLVDVYASE